MWPLSLLYYRKKGFRLSYNHTKPHYQGVMWLWVGSNQSKLPSAKLVIIGSLVVEIWFWFVAWPFKITSSKRYMTYGLELIKVSSHPTKFDSHSHFGSVSSVSQYIYCFQFAAWSLKTAWWKGHVALWIGVHKGKSWDCRRSWSLSCSVTYIYHVYY